MKKKKWKAPAWLDQYREFVSDDRIDEFMNCHGTNCDIVVNGPRALICCATTAQVQLLERIHKAGLLKNKGAVA